MSTPQVNLNLARFTYRRFSYIGGKTYRGSVRIGRVERILRRPFTRAAEAQAYSKAVRARYERLLNARPTDN